VVHAQERRKQYTTVDLVSRIGSNTRSCGGLKLSPSLEKVKPGTCITILNVPLFVVIDAQLAKICRGWSSPNRKQKLIVLRGILEGRSRERL
jgi:hypothetical protein